MLKLYDRETSGNAYKIRLLLSFLDIPHERIPVSIKDGRNQVDDAYLTLNPRGQIPSIQEDEFSLWGRPPFCVTWRRATTRRRVGCPAILRSSAR